jgi:putative nucleotidyltransferase with HDIG domain
MGGDEKVKMLIVDDEATIREVLSRTFSDKGYDCTTAESFDEAVALQQEVDFEVAMLDIMMPGKSGVDLLKSLKQSDPDIAVVVFTAVADTQTAIGAMRLGAYDYVTKPFNLVEVVMGVERALEKRNLLIVNRDYQESLESKVKEQTDEIELTFFGAISALAEALEAKDSYTNGHSKRVTEISEVIAREIGLKKRDIEKIRLAGMLHDIGKIGVPEAILNKNGKLTDEEFDVVKTHTVCGIRILEGFIRDEEVTSMIRHHHERFSGGGYPDGISGDEISIGARIMAVADAYDAMTSDRPYRKAMTPEKALEQLSANSGTQFDPEIVEAFMKVEEEVPFCSLSARPAAKAS